jgi:hypothetical protein
MESTRQLLRDAAERGALSSYEYDTWVAGIDDDPVLLLIIANDFFLALTRDAVTQILNDTLYGFPSLLNEACQILTLWCDVRRTNIDPSPIRVLVDALADHARKRKRLPRRREHRRLEIEALERMFAAAQRVIDRIANLARHHIRNSTPRREDQRQCRIVLHPTNNVATLDGEPFDLRANQYQLISLLLSAEGDFVSLDSQGLRSRDLKSLPEKLRDAIETQTGAGTRIGPKYWLS